VGRIRTSRSRLTQPTLETSGARTPFSHPSTRSSSAPTKKAGGAAQHVVLRPSGPAGTEGAVLALVDASSLSASDASNLAGEPRASLVLDNVGASGALLSEAQAQEVRARFALARAVQLAAALERVLEWTVQYAGERVQFGRPLGRFQAIQMELAEMAGEVTAVTALTDAAVQALDHASPNFELAAAAAKVRAGAAVEVVARLAHQVHGAIAGFHQGAGDRAGQVRRHRRRDRFRLHRDRDDQGDGRALGHPVRRLHQGAAAQIPVAGVGQREDIAHLVSFLVSEGAEFVSGQVVYAAGGPKA
jgi:alkylation response protein AidB-like acyl-CoA dehydrogenase